ncbi:MAG: ATP-binding cassette domain-containing protein [Candidatus Eisenbacteria bacterium]|nr:ATP-binding cassette domain-containing protein [Candidatus Eisenbacteria bacterium]
MRSPLPIEATGLTKRYGALAAVDAIDFRVARGECVGFLGPNGAGKTTTVRMVTCFTPISGGMVRVFGYDVTRHPREIKARLGVCPQEDNLDPDFSVRRNLLVYARYFGIPSAQARARTDRLLEMMQLTEKADSPIEALSGGMKRRLVIARALLNEPELLVLDEPTTGLDPQARHMIWQRIRQLRAAGTTILLTTHYMEEASQLCNRVILMDEARILLEGTPDALIAEEIGREVVELWDIPEEVRRFVQASGWITEQGEERLFVYDRTGGEVGVRIGRRFPHQSRLIRNATLEDVFLHRAGRSLRE